VAEDVRKSGTKGGVDGRGEGMLMLGGERNARKSDTFRYKECAVSEVLFEDSESGSQTVLENGLNRTESSEDKDARACCKG
jgi:6-phosphogluconate dehydrogenase (decarboxylating)